MRRPNRRTSAAFALWALVSGCAALQAGRENNEVQFHTWAPDLGSHEADRGPAKPAAATLLISTPRADPGFDTQRMVYVTRPYTLGYYATHQWVDTPAHMLAPLLAEAMERSGRFRAVLLAPTSLSGDYRLDADIVRVQQEFLRRPSQVRLALRAQLVNLRTAQLLAQRNFEIAETAPSDDPYGGVVATNRALGQVLADLTAWTASLLTK